MLFMEPVFWFFVSLLATPPLCEFAFAPNTAVELTIKYLTDPALLACYAATILTMLVSHSSSNPQLSSRDSRVATWYLLNGSVVHLAMDGLTGGFKFLPLLNKHYVQLDTRGLDAADITDDMVFHLEIIFMFPLCLWLYYLYKKQSYLRHGVEATVCALQIVGTFLFLYPEFRHGFTHVPVDWDLEFTFDHCLYFWFAFFSNFIWVVVPARLWWTAISTFGKIKMN